MVSAPLPRLQEWLRSKRQRRFHLKFKPYPADISTKALIFIEGQNRKAAKKRYEVEVTLLQTNISIYQISEPMGKTTSAAFRQYMEM